MRRRNDCPRASLANVTFTRLGWNSRLVLMLEWLTRWPIWRSVPVSSQRRDMGRLLGSNLKGGPLGEGALGVKAGGDGTRAFAPYSVHASVTHWRFYRRAEHQGFAMRYLIAAGALALAALAGPARAQ